MLTGKELGAAIETARKKKGVTKAALARAFKVSGPSVQDWVNRGTIDKGKLEAIWHYFSEVVGPEHWGLTEFPRAIDQSQPVMSWKDFAYEKARSMDAHGGPDVNHFQAFCDIVDREYSLVCSAIRPTTQGGEMSERVEGRHKRPGINTDH